MASQETKVKIVDIQVKYQDAVDAMGKYRASIEEAQASLKQLKKDLKDGKVSQEEYNRQSEASRAFIKQQNDAINTLSRQVQNQIKVTKENEGSLKQLRAELSNATAAYDAMSRAERESSKGKELKGHIVEITNELKEAEQSTLRFYRNVGNYPTSVNTAIGGLTDKFKALGTTIAAAFTVDKLWSFGDKVKDVGSAYADQMAKVQSVTNANTVEFAQMSQEAERLGSSTRYTAQEAAEALEFLTRNGLDAVTATGTLSGVLQNAQANTIELAEAADIVTGQMNAFHLSVNDVTRINDVLSYTCANSATNILQLNEALRNTAPIAYTAGVSIEETSAALGTLADNNIKGADSGTILKQAFNGLITSTKLSQKAYDELGISMDISTVKSDGLIGSLKRIMDAGPSIQQLSDIFGRRAVPGVLALTNSMDLLNEKFTNISENAAGTTERMFDQAYSKFTQAKDSLKSAWEGFLIEIWQGTDQELRENFVKQGEEIDANFVPRIEELKKQLADLNEQYAKDPENNTLLEKIKKTSEALGGVSREYILSKQLLSQQLEVEQTGNQALIEKWKQGAQVIDKEYAPKIEKIKTEISGLQEQLNNDPTSEKIQDALNAKEAELKEGIRVYSEARQEFQDSMSDEIESSTGGMAGMLQGPIEQITSIIQFAKSNIDEIWNLIKALIAGISFAKLISSSTSAFTQIRNSAVTNAQTATDNVQVCQNNEIAIRKQCASITTQLETASTTERERLETQLVAKKRELANAEKMTQKAKTAEITMWEQAAALETGNGWTKAFTVAKMGVTSFVATAKAAFKGFILTAVLSIAFELLMKLYDKIKEGKGIFGTFAKWASSAWSAIVKGVVDVINYFIDLYNESFVVRAGVQMIALQFKNLWEGVKLIFNLIIDGVKSVGRALGGMGTIIKGIVTFSPDTIKQGWNEITSNFTKTIKEGVNDFKNFGNAVAGNMVDAFNSTIKGAKVEHLKVPTETVPATKGTGKTGGKSSGGTSKGNTPSTDTNSVETEETESNSTNNGKNNKKKTTDKEDKARAKAAQEEAKLVAEAEKAMIDLLGESVEKRRAMLEAQYNGEINKLKAKLDTDKTLTEKSKDAIRQLITAKETKLQEELDKLDEDNLKKRIQEQQKLIDSRLALVRKGSEEELKLKLQQGDEKLKLDLLELKNEEEAAHKGAATALMFRQAALDELIASGTATEDQLTKARDAVAYAQGEITRINEEYAELRLNKQEEHFNKEDELRRAHEQEVLDEQMQFLQNQITQLDIANEERMNSVVNEGSDYEMTLQQSMNELGLDAVTEFEMQKLEIQQQMAEQRLQFIMDQGQLETETEAQFNARVLAGKKSVADAKAQINQASLKNEQAYAKAMGSVTKSLTGFLDVLGESNEDFAKMSKIITLFQIAVDTGKALSAGIASASSLPFPANMAAIATTVATVLANIATAVSTVKSANFAEGGKVVGPGTGTSDSIPANLSNGEYVMTAKATQMFEPLLMAMNSIGAGVPISTPNVYERVEDAESMTDTFAAAVREINPVVSVVEITEAQERIKMIENLDTF